jgi:uncharacterized protein
MFAHLQAFTGFGIGLRAEHYGDFLKTKVPVDFVEVISENFMEEGAEPHQILRQIRERHPVALHGVSMSIGSSSGIDFNYLRRLRILADAVDPLFLSDHLTWSRMGRFNSRGQLLQPYTKGALDIVCADIGMAQNFLGRSMLIENPSSYIKHSYQDMDEWDFLSEMTRRTGCGILLDINNIFVSSHNHGLDADAYLRGIPANRVFQIHLAGHAKTHDVLTSTHDRPVCGDVCALYLQAISLIGPVATMIERNDAIPPLDDLLMELDIARSMARRRHRTVEAA